MNILEHQASAPLRYLYTESLSPHPQVPQTRVALQYSRHTCDKDLSEFQIPMCTQLSY